LTHGVDITGDEEINLKIILHRPKPPSLPKVLQAGGPWLTRLESIAPCNGRIILHQVTEEGRRVDLPLNARDFIDAMRKLYQFGIDMADEELLAELATLKSRWWDE
jgi:hypothetical protein